MIANSFVSICVYPRNNLNHVTLLFFFLIIKAIASIVSHCPLISLARAPSDQSLSWPGARTTRHSWKAAGINIFCYWSLQRFTFRDFTLGVIYLLFFHDDHFQEFWILTLFFLKVNLSTNLNLSDKQEKSHSLLRCPKITRPSTLGWDKYFLRGLEFL